MSMGAQQRRVGGRRAGPAWRCPGRGAAPCVLKANGPRATRMPEQCVGGQTERGIRRDRGARSNESRAGGYLCWAGGEACMGRRGGVHGYGETCTGDARCEQGRG